MKRQGFLRELRRLMCLYGSGNVVYFDETGFAGPGYRPYAWALRGKKVYADVPGKRQKRTNLLMAQRGKDRLTPWLFEGSCTAEVVNTWLEAELIPALDKPSIVVMDNAPFHKEGTIRAILEAHGHVLLPLPKYSPDFNPIEKTFGNIKKQRQALPPDTPIENLI